MKKLLVFLALLALGALLLKLAIGDDPVVAKTPDPAGLGLVLRVFHHLVRRLLRVRPQVGDFLVFRNRAALALTGAAVRYFAMEAFEALVRRSGWRIERQVPTLRSLCVRLAKA